VPDLRYVGWTRSKEYLERMLASPSDEVPGTYMPAVRLPESLGSSIVEYLVMQQHPLPSAPEEVFDEVCASCHSEERVPEAVVLSKEPPLLGGRNGPEESAFSEIVAQGKVGTAMAPWQRVFSPRFVSKLFDVARERDAARHEGGGR